MYGLIGMRENLTKKEEPPQRFNPVQFVQNVAGHVAQDVREEFNRATGHQQR